MMLIKSGRFDMLVIYERAPNTGIALGDDIESYPDQDRIYFCESFHRRVDSNSSETCNYLRQLEIVKQIGST